MAYPTLLHFKIKTAGLSTLTKLFHRLERFEMMPCSFKWPSLLIRFFLVATRNGDVFFHAWMSLLYYIWIHLCYFGASHIPLPVYHLALCAAYRVSCSNTCSITLFSLPLPVGCQDRHFYFLDYSSKCFVMTNSVWMICDVSAVC